MKAEDLSVMQIGEPIETFIAQELTQQLVENQIQIILRMQKQILEQTSEDWYLTELEAAIDSFEKLLTALRTGKFAILTKS